MVGIERQGLKLRLITICLFGFFVLSGCSSNLYNENPTYTVTYNDNGSDSGSVPVDGNNYEEGQTVTVLANTGNLTKSGYTFVGWNTQDDGSGTDRAAGTTFTMGNANVTLYAKWTQNPTYTVTYSGNGRKR